MPDTNDAPDDEVGLPLVVPVEHDPFDVAAQRVRAPYARASGQDRQWPERMAGAIAAPWEALSERMQAPDPIVPGDPSDPFEMAAARTRAPFAKAIALHPASGLIDLGNYFGHKLMNAITAPGDALYGRMQVTDPETGMPTREAIERGQSVAGMAMTGGIPMAQRGAMGMAGGKLVQPAETAAGTPAITAYHGSPHDFERFDISKIGTGEGAQAYGHGLYFAENEGVAQSYKDVLKGASTDWSNPKQIAGHFLDQAGGDRDSAGALLGGFMSRPRPGYDKTALADAHKILQSGGDVTPPSQGKMYQVAIKANPEHFLDWDKPLSAQHSKVLEALSAIEKKNAPATSPSWDLGGQLGRLRDHLAKSDREMDAGMFVKSMEGAYGHEGTAQALREAGIPGIKYLDERSRGMVGGVDKLGDNYFVKGSMKPYKTRAEAEAAAEESGARTRNYVVFDDKLIDILKKYGMAGLAALPAMGAYHFQTKQADHDPFTPDDGRMRPAPAAGPQVPISRLSPQGVVDGEGGFMDNMDEEQAAPGLVEAFAHIPVRDELLTEESKNIERRGDYDIFDKFRYHPLFDQIKRLFDERHGTDNKLSKEAGAEDIDRVVKEALLRTYGRKQLVGDKTVFELQRAIDLERGAGR